MSVLCVCLSVYLYSRTAGHEAARERYTRLQRNKRSNNNVADLAETAAFWQEKPAQPWTTFRDPTHQLARCACLFYYTFGAPHARPLERAALPGIPRCCIMLLQVPLACFRTVVSVTRVCSYIPHGSCCRSCVRQLLARAALVFAQTVFAPRVCTLVLFISTSNDNIIQRLPQLRPCMTMNGSQMATSCLKM